VLLTLGATVALTAAGCSSSSKSAGTSGSTSATTGSGSGSSQAGATGTPIVVGNVSNLSNQSLGIQPDDSATPKAWVAWTNAHGGIDGHPVKLVQPDDAGDPATALSDVQQLVQQDHVLALVGNQDTATDTAYTTVLTQAGVPNVGGADFSNVWYQNDASRVVKGSFLVLSVGPSTGVAAGQGWATSGRLLAGRLAPVDEIVRGWRRVDRSFSGQPTVGRQPITGSDPPPDLQGVRGGAGSSRSRGRRSA
jgi:hypothetical protein